MKRDHPDELDTRREPGKLLAPGPLLKLRGQCYYLPLQLVKPRRDILRHLQNEFAPGLRN
jgi:hypothetical protein